METSAREALNGCHFESARGLWWTGNLSHEEIPATSSTTSRRSPVDLMFWSKWLTCQIIIGIEAYWTLRLFGLIK